MKSSLLQEILLYRYRYIIGYLFFIILLLGLLLTDFGSVPQGISSAEMSSTVSSNSLNVLKPNAGDVINLPYHLLQKASVSLLGLSPISIRLPSLILALAAGLVLALTLLQWFRKGVAMLALLIATASVPFITMGRVGTPGVLYMLLLLVILLGAVKLTTHKTGTFGWKLLVAIAGVLMLYMPLGIYTMVGLLIAGVFHPHIRHQIKRTKPWQMAVLITVSCLLLAPIVLAIINDNNTLQTLFGLNAIKDTLSGTGLLASLSLIAKSLFMFNKPFVGEMITPFLTLPFMLFVAFGLIRCIYDHHSARSYLLLIWLAIAVPLLVINPSQFALLFVPCLMLMAIGIETFIREWYKLFPRNPYARVSGLIPVTLITLGMVTIATSRYFYGYYYTDTSTIYKPELSAIQQVAKTGTTTGLIVPSEQVAFYDILRRSYPKMTVSSSITDPGTKQLIVLSSSMVSQPSVPSKIVTSHLSQNAVVLRVYNKAE
ncbi:MAG: glycosyltransferase family 39 protein [Candidatus Saccharimonadales bacterium]